MSSNFIKLSEALKDFLPIQSMVFGMEFDFSHHSLKGMELAINSAYPQGHNPMDTTIFMLGFYFGETLVKNVEGAAWVTPSEKEDENPYDWGISVPIGGSPDHKFTAFPMERMSNFWSDRTNTLYGFCSMLKDITSGLLSLDAEVDHIGDGYTFKARKASRSEEEVLKKSGKSEVCKRANN
jgi:hypothetical protein